MSATDGTITLTSSSGLPNTTYPPLAQRAPSPPPQFTTPRNTHPSHAGNTEKPLAYHVLHLLARPLLELLPVLPISPYTSLPPPAPRPPQSINLPLRRPAHEHECRRDSNPPSVDHNPAQVPADVGAAGGAPPDPEPATAAGHGAPARRVHAARRVVLGLAHDAVVAAAAQHQVPAREEESVPVPRQARDALAGPVQLDPQPRELRGGGGGG